MADYVSNQAKGKFAEWAARVNANDPANSVLVVALLAEEGVESDATLRDKDNFEQLVAGATNFATNTGSTRKSLSDSGGITITVDDTNDRTDVDMPDQTWTALANDGTGKISDVVIGYDSDSTGGTDANVVFGTQHDFAITPDGSDVTLVVAELGFFRAS
jgi:hypothetical protein